MPHVVESKTALQPDSGFQVLDCSFCQGMNLDSSFQSLVGFQIPFQLYSGFQSPGFRIPKAKISLIPDSEYGFSFMGREISRFTTFLSIRIVLSCLYVLAFYFEKFTT